jgi:type II secretory ATPase GspE/PulE/Tfp pilus assembly ATPase PilB-like protein
LPNNSRVYAQIGCNHCNGTGYKGRLAIYEYIIIDDEMRSQMAGEDYRPFAVEKILKTGISTMLNNGVKNILAGNTSVSEVVKAVFRK